MRSPRRTAAVLLGVLGGLLASGAGGGPVGAEEPAARRAPVQASAEQGLAIIGHLRGYLEPPEAPLVALVWPLRVAAWGDVALLATPSIGRFSERSVRLLGAPVDPALGIGARLDRARLGLALTGPVGLGLVVRGELGEEPLVGGRLLEALAGWSLWPALRLSVGIGKVPYSRSNLLPAASLLFSTRSVGGESFSPARRLGGTVEGDVGVLTYAVGAYTTSPGYGDPGPGALLAGRLEVIPLGPVPWLEGAPQPWAPWYDWTRLVVGAGGLALVDGAGLRTYALTGDLHLVKRGFAAGVEINYGTNVEFNRLPGQLDPASPPRGTLPGDGILPPQPVASPPPFLTGAVRGSLFLWPGLLEAALRVELVDSWLPAQPSALLVTGGLNVYPFARRLRARIAYLHRAELSGGQIPNDALLLGFEGSL